jgi:hypothetical protein
MKESLKFKVVVYGVALFLTFLPDNFGLQGFAVDGTRDRGSGRRDKNYLGQC